MRAFTFKEFIARPPADVWATLTDLSLAPRWRPLIKSMETEDGQPVHEGSRVKIVFQLAGMEQSRVSTTIAFDPPRRWTLRSSDNPAMEGVFDFRLEPEAGGTLVVATCDLRAHGLLPWLYLPLIGYGERQRRREMLGNLKRLVEGGESLSSSRAERAEDLS